MRLLEGFESLLGCCYAVAGVFWVVAPKHSCNPKQCGHIKKSKTKYTEQY